MSLSCDQFNYLLYYLIISPVPVLTSSLVTAITPWVSWTILAVAVVELGVPATDSFCKRVATTFQ